MKYFLISSFFLFQSLALLAKPKEIPLNSNTVFKDINGKQISFDTFIQWTSGGAHEIAPSFDEDGKLLEVFVLEASIAPMRNSAVPMSTAPPFEATTVNNQHFSWNELQGKVVVLKFWFAACKPCVDEIPQLNQVVEKYRDNPDVVFIAPSLDRKAQIEAFLQKHPFLYHIAPQAKQQANQYGVFGYPTHYVINRLGKIEATFQGVNHNIETLLGDAIDSALNPVEYSEFASDIPIPPTADEVQITPQSIIKNKAGEIIPFEKFTSMMRQAHYELQNATDADGNAYILMSPVGK